MAAFTKILGRRDKSVVPLLSMYLKYNKNAHSMYGCECHAAIAKPAAAVTRVQSPSQEVGSGDNGLGFTGCGTVEVQLCLLLQTSSCVRKKYVAISSLRQCV